MGGVQPDKQRERRNKRVGIVMGGVALGMVGMGFASAPLYRLFCQVTGLNGTVSRAEASELDFSQAVKGQTIRCESP
jgi:cytochrome c oxidase assembly protein subunit 11